MKFYTLFILLLSFSQPSCLAQVKDGGVSQKSAQAHPDTERDSVKKIDIHYKGEQLRREVEYEKGKATYYLAHGKRTASGEKHDKNAMVCAHKKLPFGTLVRVVNEKNKKEVVVRVNDRGPFGKGMVIDLSLAAAKEIDLVQSGVVPVTLYILQ